MFSVTLALALLLGTGVLAGRLARMIRLPSVTGYIVAGLLIGPFGLHMIDEKTASQDLGHFTNMALMLISFGIGEHLELGPLRRAAKVVSGVALGESLGAFVLVGAGCWGAAWALGLGPDAWGLAQYTLFGLLLGSVAVATAPASTLHVTREVGATGPVTSTLLPVVAVDNALAILLFGVIFTVATQMVSAAQGPLVLLVARSVGQTLLALAMGLAGGLVLDFIILRLKSRAEMLTVGLAVLLLCGEAARLMGLQPLLTGIAVGFMVVNHGRRDVRIFRAINDFEPPIYVLFFTLAGAHVDVSALGVAGGLVGYYFLLRAGGKMGGAWVGARLARAPETVRRWLGPALLPQAGVAIGLVFMIEGQAAMDAYNDIITPLVLASVMLAEILGPVTTRLSLQRAGETSAAPEGEEEAPGVGVQPTASGVEGLQIFPWRWDPLAPSGSPRGQVLFGLDQPDVAVGLARLATILSHHLGALPLGLRVGIQESLPRDSDEQQRLDSLINAATAEVESIGYRLETLLVPADSLGEGLNQAMRELSPRALLLGQQFNQNSRDTLRLAEAVAGMAVCPVLVVRFGPVLSTRRILIPVVSRNELRVVRQTVTALARVGMHEFTLLQSLPPHAPEDEVAQAEEEMLAWADEAHLGQQVTAMASTSQSRAESILEEAAQHDLVVMAARRTLMVERMFFGSLATDILTRSPCTVILIHRPRPAD